MSKCDRDFGSRPVSEREWLLSNSWCDRCRKADLGIDNPREYELDGTAYIEGECRRCRAVVRSGVIERDAT